MFSNIHYHHTVPRALGGEHSLQIPLCGACHTSLHAKALAVFAFTAGKRKEPISNYWDNPEDEERASKWVAIIVQAIIDCPDGLPVLLSSVLVKAEIHTLLNMMKADLSLGSMEKTLRFCIIETLKSKGYINEKANQSSGSNKQASKLNELWGMRRS